MKLPSLLAATLGVLASGAAVPPPPTTTTTTTTTTNNNNNNTWGNETSPRRSLQRGRRLFQQAADEGLLWYLRSYGGDNRSPALARRESDGSWACYNADSSPPLPLRDPVVVVGTDGSGTRAVAAFLALMNVTVLVEQSVRSQLDVDGSKAGVHFTGAIQRLLATTKSPNYRLADLPRELAAGITTGLVDGFAANMRSNACAAGIGSPTRIRGDGRRRAEREGRGGRDREAHRPDWPAAPGAAWAFKKPDLMNLLPFLLAAFPKMQVLHVVRDGRDMAFSHNHAPLRKYSTCLLASAKEGGLQEGASISNPRGAMPSTEAFAALDEAEKQVVLWNLQNLGVAAWGRANAANYHWMRIEGLSLSSGHQQEGAAEGAAGAAAETETTRHFANLVRALVDGGEGGGEIREHALEQRVAGVLFHLESTQLGSHDRAVREGSRDDSRDGGGVKSRYGKWRKLASDKQKKSLNRLGRAGLEWFGYL